MLFVLYMQVVLVSRMLLMLLAVIMLVMLVVLCQRGCSRRGRRPVYPLSCLSQAAFKFIIA